VPTIRASSRQAAPLIASVRMARDNSGQGWRAIRWTGQFASSIQLEHHPRLNMKLCLASYIGLMAFSGTLGAQATNLNRFRDPEGITADPTGLRRDTSVRAFPRYPRDLQEKAITGALVAAFVIDTTGRVELETASFLRTSRPEFVKAVCDLLPKLRFQPFVVGDQKWRVLLVATGRTENGAPEFAALSGTQASVSEAS
jgi:hypothetical protein